MKHPFSFDIVYSSRRTIAVQITSDGQIKVRAPYGCPRSFIDSFLFEKEKWILSHLEKARRRPSRDPRPLPESVRKRYIETAREIFSQKTACYARIMGVTYGRISIREQKTRWGSCSSSGNLNFNWRLILAPEPVLDYVVVHELAHRREMNHSRAFYDIVRSVLPDYKEAQKWLRQNGDSLWSAV